MNKLIPPVCSAIGESGLSILRLKAWPFRLIRPAVLYLLCISGAQRLLFSQAALNDRVLVIYNSNVAESLDVAKYYMAERNIPAKNRCKVSFRSDDGITQEEFERHVKMQVRACLEAAGKQKILYIVLSYRTPYALTIHDRTYSLDQFIADIWDEYSTTRTGNGVGPHPYFGGAQSQGNAYSSFVPLTAYREQPRALNIYSVWRLDAAKPDLARDLVNKAIFAEKNGLSGKGCFDRQSGPIDAVGDYGYGSGDWDIYRAADFARRAGLEVTEDDQKAEFGTPPAPLRCDSAALYAGWYSLNHYNDAFTWNPGAIGFHLDSLSAVNPRGGTNWCANAVIKGITVTSGAVAEPFLPSLPHPDQIFLYLFQGANVGDALLRCTPWLKWMIVNIGDPLYRPYPRGVAPFNSPGYQETFLALAPQSLAGGGSSSGYIGLSSPAPQGGTTVSIQSDRPDIVTVPQKITIAQAARDAKFAIVTRAVPGETAVRVSIVMGDVKRSNTLVLYGPQTQPKP